VELAVAISIIAVLATVLLDRLAYYKEMAEKAAMESMVRIIKTGLQIRLAELIIGNRQAQAAALEADDPTQWLDGAVVDSVTGVTLLPVSLYDWR
jgi:general secretion pathway protein G